MEGRDLQKELATRLKNAVWQFGREVGEDLPDCALEVRVSNADISVTPLAATSKQTKLKPLDIEPESAER